MIRKGIAVIAASLIASGAAFAGGDVAGKVSWDGKVPGRKALKMQADPVCASKHTGKVLSERVLVGEGGGMQNVFVYVSKGLEGKTFDVPAEPVVLDQKGCLYTPKVMGVMAGQKIKILNNDGTLHNVHPKPKVNKEFNLAMPKFMKMKEVSLDKPEVMIPVKCDVHPWMSGHIGVLSHPHYNVSDGAGSFALKGVPAGSYTITAWHEVFGTKSMDVTVAEGGSVSADFTYSMADVKKN
jgi:plastocyanin